MSSKEFLCGYNTTKYNNKKVTVDGIEFDSRKEARRYAELKLLEKAGKIKDLELQKKFVLIPAQKRNGKVVERECSYFADFVYTDVDTGETIVEDTKGFITKDYIIKRKLLLFNFNIKITEI